MSSNVFGQGVHLHHAIILTLVARMDMLVLARSPTEGERGGQEMSFTTTEILVLRPWMEAVKTTYI